MRDMLRDYQQKAIDELTRAFKGGAKSAVISAATGCHAKGQQILMHNMTRKLVEDVEVGDLLMGPDSRPRRVLSLARGRGEMVRIVPIKGDSFVVNMDHILTLARTGTGEMIDITVRDWLGRSPTFKHLYKLVRASVDPDIPRAALPIDPYVLGVLIGDGCLRRTVMLTTPDQEPHDALAEEASRFGLVYRRVGIDGWAVQPSTARRGRGIKGNKLRNALVALGLDVNSADKSIPDAYLRASRRDRLALLAGLIDTDGSLTTNCFDWITASRRLADDFVFLIRSLGFGGSVRPCQKTCQTGAVGIFFRVCVSGDLADVPTRVPRKRGAKRQQKRNVLVTGFRVEMVGDDDFYGFCLDGDGRFLLGDCTITHNTGKSRLFRRVAEGAAEKGHRSMLIVRGDALVRQAATHFRASGLSVGVEMGTMRSAGEQVVVASVDSLRGRMDRFTKSDFAVVQIDECHHCMAPSQLRILADLGFAVPEVSDKGEILESKTPRETDALLVGYTATPDRGDKLDIMQVFETVAFEYDIQTAIGDGWLVPIRQEMCVLDGLDLSKVRTAAGDLSAAELGRVLEPLIEPMAREICEVAGMRPTIIYSPLVKLAHQMTDVLRRVEPGPRVETIDGATDDQRRQEFFAAFQQGVLQRLSSVGTLTEGVDLPAAAVAAVCRMTKVRALYTQIVGRVLRLPPGVDHLPTAEARRLAISRSVKPYATVLDFAGNSGRHKLVRLIDLFTDDLAPGVADLAAKHLDEADGDPMGAIGLALSEIEEMVARVRGSKIERILVDPFELWDIPRQRDSWGRLATPAQVDTLLNAGVVPVKRGRSPTEQAAAMKAARDEISRLFDFKSASKMIDRIVGRTRQDLATVKQVRMLISKGIPRDRAMELTFADANKSIDELERCGWKPTTAWIRRWASSAPAQP